MSYTSIWSVVMCFLLFAICFSLLLCLICARSARKSFTWRAYSALYSRLLFFAVLPRSSSAVRVRMLTWRSNHAAPSNGLCFFFPSTGVPPLSWNNVVKARIERGKYASLYKTVDSSFSAVSFSFSRRCRRINSGIEIPVL